jgi:flagellar biosynthetic protein FliP
MLTTAALEVAWALTAAPAAPKVAESSLLLGLLAIAVLPALLAVTTAFARIVIVLYFLRAGMGSTVLPPNVVVLGLGLLLTWYVMSPTLTQLSREAVTPMYQGRMAADQALAKSETILRGFMRGRVAQEDYLLLAQVRGLPADPARAPFEVVAAAFALGELRVAFLAGLLVYLPFLIIDLLVFLVLGALGGPPFSPQLFALPAKVLFFVMADGWRLVFGALSRSYLGG